MALDQDALRTLSGETTATPALRNTRRWRKWVVMGLLLAAGVGFMVMKGRAPLPVTLVAATALPANAPPAAVLDASGFVVARRQATVSAKVTAKVIAIFVEEGMAVKAGQVLAKLDTSQASLQHGLAEKQIEAANANVNEIQVRLTEARRTLTRNEKLQAAGMISDAALDAARADVASLTAQQDAVAGQLAVTQSALKLRAQDLDDLTVRAPFAGVVISKDAQPGEMVSPISAGGGYTRTGIATIVDMDSREIEVDVNEAFINRVHDGQKAEATLDAYSDWRIPAHVLNIVPAADRQKATVRVRIAFDQLDSRILPDMGVKVRFLQNVAAQPTARVANVALVPSSALSKDGDQDYVWIIAAGRAQRAPVKTGNVRDSQTEVLSGLKAGDMLIASPPTGIAVGTRVRAATPATT
jgi:RND family efflux transporter MFP subunit